MNSFIEAVSKAIEKLGFNVVKLLKPKGFKAYCHLKGICYECGKHGLLGTGSTVLCRDCYDARYMKQRESKNYMSRLNYDRKKRNRICVKCGGRTEDGHAYCSYCREFMSKYRTTWINSWDLKVGDIFPKKMAYSTIYKGLRLGLSKEDLANRLLQHVTAIEQVDPETKLIVTANRLQFRVVKYNKKYNYFVIGKSI